MLEMLTNPAAWPLVDILPLARPEPGELWPQLGVLVRGRGLTVYLTDALRPGLHRRLLECEKIYYATAEEVLRDRWAVD